MSKIGYARVSTRDQNLARQIEQLHDAGVNKIFQEKLSGKNADRPQLKAMLDYIRDGLKSIFETDFKRHSEPRLPSTAQINH